MVSEAFAQISRAVLKAEAGPGAEVVDRLIGEFVPTWAYVVEEGTVTRWTWTTPAGIWEIVHGQDIRLRRMEAAAWMAVPSTDQGVAAVRAVLSVFGAIGAWVRGEAA